MRRALAALAALAAMLVTVPLVSAASHGTDARGDVEGSPAGGSAGADLVRATGGRNSRGQLVHTVTVAGSAADPAGGGVVPRLHIQLPEDPDSDYDSQGTAECTLFVGGHRGRFGVFRCGYADRVGSARVERTSAGTIRFTFSKKVLDGARHYDWAALTRASGTENGSWTRHDRLPSGDDVFLRYRVR